MFIILCMEIIIIGYTTVQSSFKFIAQTYISYWSDTMLWLVLISNLIFRGVSNIFGGVLKKCIALFFTLIIYYIKQIYFSHGEV